METALAALAALLAVIGALRPDWIELVLYVDSDNHSGSTEWGLVIALVLSSLLFTALARRIRQQLTAA